MNVADAAHKTVKAYPGGSEALGPRIDMSPAVLRSKVNPNNDTHHLTLTEASEVMGVTGDHRMLHALAAEHGYALVPVESGEGGIDILAAALMTDAAKGNLSRLLVEALADGVVTANEAKGLMAAGADAQAAVVKLLASAQAMVPQAGQGT